MSEVRVVRRWPANEYADGTAAAPARATPSARLRMIAIAGSTGAPGVIADILETIAPSLACPVVIVQHLAESFVDGFAAWLRQRTRLAVTVAQHGMHAARRGVYLAPDDLHLGIGPDAEMVLTRGPAEEGFRPCANHLFRSVAANFGRAALGIVLTGMGRDGAAGLLELRRAGGITVAQDEASSPVFGMPAEAIRMRAAMHVLSPADIASFVASCCV